MGIFRIIATLGPASLHLAAELRDAGADAFRLNASHIVPDELGSIAAAVRRQVPGCLLVVDLQGAKMRLGSFTEREVHAGDRVLFSHSGSGEAVRLPHKEIFAAVGRGETLTFDDDRLRFRVMTSSGDTLEAVALSDGTLRPRKGANVLEHPVTLSDLTETDRACIEATAGLGSVSFAFSFMKDGSEAAWVRRRAPGCPVVGKIERREAAEQVHGIAERVDALWICRGDLGAQLGLSEMARLVGRYDPRQEPCPVLMAGQVLEHMTTHPSPTRSEVCHIFDLVQRGYAGFVLSDETAIGRDPAGAVRMLHSLC